MTSITHDFRTPLDHEYATDLGYALYIFATLEHDIRWLGEHLHPGFATWTRRKTAHQIAERFASLVSLAATLHDDVRKDAAILAVDFLELVKDRNALVHGMPCTAPDGSQRLTDVAHGHGILGRVEEREKSGRPRQADPGVARLCAPARHGARAAASREAGDRPRFWAKAGHGGANAADPPYGWAANGREARRAALEVRPPYRSPAVGGRRSQPGFVPVPSPPCFVATERRRPILRDARCCSAPAALLAA